MFQVVNNEDNYPHKYKLYIYIFYIYVDI